MGCGQECGCAESVVDWAELLRDNFTHIGINTNLGDSGRSSTTHSTPGTTPMPFVCAVRKNVVGAYVIHRSPPSPPPRLLPSSPHPSISPGMFPAANPGTGMVDLVSLAVEKDFHVLLDNGGLLTFVRYS